MTAPTGATPQKRQFFNRMSADGVSPASLRAARITETDLQEAEGSESKATLGGIAKQVQKARFHSCSDIFLLELSCGLHSGNTNARICQEHETSVSRLGRENAQMENIVHLGLYSPESLSNFTMAMIAFQQ